MLTVLPSPTSDAPDLCSPRSLVGLTRKPRLKLLSLTLLAALGLAHAARAADPYEDYVRDSEDFRAVKQDRDWAAKAFPSWTIMPYTAKWPAGFTDATARWCRDTGLNGAYADRDFSANGTKTGRLDWIDKNGLRFYTDHTADKGLLHLWDGDKVKDHVAELRGTGVRPVPLNAATRE